MMLLAFVFSLAFLINDRVNLHAKMMDDLKSHNDRIEQKFSDSLLYTKLIMSYVGRQIANNEKKHDLNFIRNLLVSYHIPENGLMSWSIFSWADENHQLLVSSGLGILHPRKDLSMRDYMPLTKQYPETMQIGAPVFGVLSRLWSIPIGYGVMDMHRQYIGSVVTGIIVENLKSQVEALITNNNIFFAIVDPKNQIITKSTALESEANREFLNKFMEKVVAAGGENVSYKYAYYQRLKGYEHGVITLYNRDVLFSALNDNLIIYLAVTFLLLSFISLIVYTFHNNITAAITEISEYVGKIARNEQRQVRKFEIAELEDLSQKLHRLDSSIHRKQ